SRAQGPDDLGGVRGRRPSGADRLSRALRWLPRLPPPRQEFGHRSELLANGHEQFGGFKDPVFDRGESSMAPTSRSGGKVRG
ncbi:MAG TPA: hypothetical protein PKD55_16835, partial [Bellilinea sp.]|nr:hypothetical protein [Bellilinea sp.]